MESTKKLEKSNPKEKKETFNLRKTNLSTRGRRLVKIDLSNQEISTESQNLQKTERFIRTEKQIITSYVDETQDNWDEHLSKLAFVYNIIPTESQNFQKSLEKI